MANQKKALVTGASEGIGRIFAQRLATEGYEITSVARNEKRLKELVAGLGAGSHSYRMADLSTPEGVEVTAAELGKNHYNLLINNVGFGVYGAFYQTDVSKLQTMTRLNCDALVALAHAFLKAAQSGDALINLSSALAFLPMPSAGVYAATKAFVTSFSESLWYEQKDRGIYVMGLCPGITTTNFHERAGGTAEDRPPQGLAQTPEAVVDVALKALKKRSDPTVISGSKNTIMTTLTRIMPRKNVVSMMGNMAK